MTESFEQICKVLLAEKAKKPPSFSTSLVQKDHYDCILLGRKWLILRHS